MMKICNGTLIKVKYQTNHIFPRVKYCLETFSKGCLTQFLNTWPPLTIGIEPITALL